MTPVAALARAYRTEERKRLGQYFTGERLAKLLGALAEGDQARAVIDPMAGSGDMLVAIRQIGAERASLTAVEIDPLAAAQCSERLRAVGQPASVTLVGDAFSPTTWADVEIRDWDLVITNPPYVRYQRSTRRGAGRIALPSSGDVRTGLQAILQTRSGLSLEDRRVLGILSDAYSGLADLAVPAWILCASLVSTGGRLAMVLPDTWLSRDYAIPVLYLLRRYFEIECIVEDGEAAWFEDALVRTTLLVARRVEDRGTAMHDTDTGHLHLRLNRGAADHKSLVGQLHAESLTPEHEFARNAGALRRSRESYMTDDVSAQWVSDRHFRDLVATNACRSSWIYALEADVVKGSASTIAGPSVIPLPRQIRELAKGAVFELRTLADYGWRVGQGLRTGANRFFYAESISETATTALLAIDTALGLDPLPVPRDLVRPVVRKQHDLLAARGVARDSPGRLLVLADHALPEDVASAERLLGQTPYQVIPEPLAEHLRIAARLNVGSAEAPLRLPELSAVATNVRRADPSRPTRAPRFWYQLPALVARHVPELFIPRVNHGHPYAVMNKGAVVIDANFSSLWREGREALTPNALLALMHSSWVLAFLEASATVLGGGALKVEATHLRRLPLPSLDVAALDQLDCFGGQLTLGGQQNHASTREQINELVWSALLGSAFIGCVRDEAEQAASRLLGLRNPRLVGSCSSSYKPA